MSKRKEHYTIEEFNYLRGKMSRNHTDLLCMASAKMTYRAMADALGIPMGTVRSRLNRARNIAELLLWPDDRTEVEKKEFDLKIESEMTEQMLKEQWEKSLK